MFLPFEDQFLPKWKADLSTTALDLSLCRNIRLGWKPARIGSFRGSLTLSSISSTWFLLVFVFGGWEFPEICGKGWERDIFVWDSLGFR